MTLTTGSAEVVAGKIDWPAVSVVIVTKGNRELAEQAVASIIAAEYPPDRLQIVVLEETDAEVPITGRGVEYHRIPVRHRGVGYARNTALAHARHGIVAFTDDDCVVDRAWLKEIVRPLTVFPTVAAAAGAVRVPACGAVGRCENILGFPGGGLKHFHRANGRYAAVPTFSTCNCSVNRRLHPDLRFEEGFQAAGEDELLSRTLAKAHTILYAPKAAVYHKPRDSFGAVFKWFVRRGQARVEMLRHTDDKKRFIWRLLYASPLLRLSALTAVCFISGIPLFPALVGVGLLYYASVLWRFRWAINYGPPAGAFLLLPLVKSTMDLGLDAGTLITLLARRHPR